MREDEQRIKAIVEHGQFMKELITCQAKKSIPYTVGNGEAYEVFKRKSEKSTLYFRKIALKAV